MVADFLESFEDRPYQSDQEGDDLRYFSGQGGSFSLEIAVVDLDSRPTKEYLRQLYRDRRDGRPNPIVAVAVYGSYVGLCGPSGEDPPVYVGIDREKAERVCASALEEPDRHSAQLFLSEMLPQLDEDLTGLRNQGLLSTHELETGVPQRADWEEAGEHARRVLSYDDPRDLIQGLNYEITELTDQSYVLSDNSDGHQRAVAVFLQEDESFDHAQERFVGQSPVAYALKEADKRNIEYVIGNNGDTFRLYTTNPDAGFGSRGRTDTFVEINTGLLADDEAAYLWLLFSANALRDDGSLHEIMERSKDYATALGNRLRERIYDDVVPALAEAIARARDLSNPTKDELDETYRMTLVLLYRLLFIAYAEDEEFLPRRHNERYNQHSLKEKAHELHRIVEEGGEFDAAFDNHWNDVMFLSRAVHEGSDELGLPAYNGTLLSEDPAVSDAGAKLARIQLNNADFGPVLANLLIDETADGYQGPVDFRNIGVRDFGVIYEGLLESELSVADEPLRVDDQGQYIPVDPEAEPDHGIAVEAGQVYLHGQSGERKATGTYYTKTRFVEHLLDYSLEPALDEHIERLDRLRDQEGDNAAAEVFFDLRVTDIAMGSGHFLVGAVDRIESRLYSYLTDNPLPPVEEELDNLEDAALSAFKRNEYGPNIERGQLLRRQVARRCVYGVDLNPLATELARLSIWVHTFVPGLPLTFLDYNLVTGDSLAGIGTLDEISDILDVEQSSLDMFTGGESVMNEIRANIDELGRYADASAEQVKEARQTRAEIEQQLEEVRARFDVLAAHRLDDTIEINPVQDASVDITRENCYAQAKNALTSTAPLHFPAAFPEVFDSENPGFDVVVGNPPWEEATLEEKEFWARYIPGFQAKTDEKQEELKKKLIGKRRDLLEKFEREKEEKTKLADIITSGPYRGSSAGGSAPEIFVAFVSRFYQITKNNGHIGAVVPRTAFSGDNTSDLREEIFNNCDIRDITFLVNNNGWVFDSVHGQKTIALAGFRKTQSPTRALPLRGPFYSREEYEQGMMEEAFNFELETIQNLTSSLVVPLPPSQEAVDVFYQLVTGNEKFDFTDGDWRAVPVTPLKLAPYEDELLDDGTTLLHRSESPPADNFLPVAGGKCIDFWQYDESKVSVWTDPDLIYDYLQNKRISSYERAGSRSPFSPMPKDWIYDNSTLPCHSARVVFRDSTNKTNRRTVIPALVPPEVIMLDTAPYLIWPKGDERDQAYLMGIMGSIPFDWCARRFVESHVSFYLLRGLPVPRTSTTNPLWERMVKLSGELAATGERYSDWANSVGVSCEQITDETREDFANEIDAVSAHLYGLSRNHVKVIFETFHEGWDYRERLDHVLEYYDEWADRLDLDHSKAEDEAKARSNDDD